MLLPLGKEAQSQEKTRWGKGEFHSGRRIGGIGIRYGKRAQPRQQGVCPDECRSQDHGETNGE